MVKDGNSGAPYVTELTEISVEIVSAYVGHNAVSATDLPGLIKSVYEAVTGLNAPGPAVVSPVQEPAVAIKKSVTPDFLICLEDGKKFKSLKRHLAQLGLTPDAYRRKWNLPSDYPMVAPNYTAARSKIALETGLGKKRETAAAPETLKKSRPKKAGPTP